MASSKLVIPSTSSDLKDLLIYGSLGICLGVGATKLFSYYKSSETKIKHKNLPNPFGSSDYTKMVQEQLVRNIQFFGQESQDKISNSFIIIFGVGGIGSHVLSAVVRSGIKKIRIVDPGYITVQLLNKHAFATSDQIGMSRVNCCAEFVKKIFPHIEIETVKVVVSTKNIEKLLEGNPSYVVDCMGEPEAKAVLIDQCMEKKIKVVTSGGTSMKINPTLIQVSELKDVRNDGILRSVRMKLKARARKPIVKAIFSVETAKQSNSIADSVKSSWLGKEVIKPTFGVMTALIGYSVASYVLCDLAEQMYKPLPMDDVKVNDYERLYKNLIQKEIKRGIPERELEVDIEDVYILVREVFEWTCVITDKKYHNLELVRWNPKKKASIRNLVLMSESAAKEHNEYTDLVGKYNNVINKEIDQKFHKLEEVLAKRSPSYQF